MKVFLHNTSVFDVKAEAIVLPVDLTAKGMSGSIARQFQKIVGETDWLDIEAQIEFPFPNGKMRVANMMSNHLPFQEAVFLGSLTHSPEHNPAAIMRSAFDEACEWVGRMTVQGLATPLLTGGHRLSPRGAARGVGQLVDLKDIPGSTRTERPALKRRPGTLPAGTDIACPSPGARCRHVEREM